MTGSTLLLVALGGAVGAILRYLIDRGVQAAHDLEFPFGTFTVNVGGSLVLGALAGAGASLPGWAVALLATGFCGALTTYSTFALETWRLAEEGRPRLAIVNALGTPVACLTAVGLAYALVSTLVGGHP